MACEYMFINIITVTTQYNCNIFTNVNFDRNYDMTVLITMNWNIIYCSYFFYYYSCNGEG